MPEPATSDCFTWRYSHKERMTTIQDINYFNQLPLASANVNRASIIPGFSPNVRGKFAPLFKGL